MTTVYTPESRVWITSDLHLGHDKEFIWGTRGFNSVQDMNETIIKILKKTVQPTDELYICGDVTLGEIDLDLLKQIPGHVHVILGNHDTDARAQIYKNLGWSVSLGERIKYTDGTKKGQMSFLLTHYPTDTGNIDKKLNERVLSVSGHTHSKNLWHPNGSYNVCLDAHDNKPVSLQQIISDFTGKYVQMS